MKKAFLFPLLLVLVFSIAVIKVCYGDGAGLGISDCDLRAITAIGEQKQFEVAKIDNVGELVLNISIKWIPDFNVSMSDLELRFTPTTTMLYPQESLMIFVDVVHAGNLGVFSGVIDISTVVQIPENYTGGNPSVPGGTAHAQFTIVESQIKPQNTDLALMVGIPVIALVNIIAVVVYKKRKRKK